MNIANWLDSRARQTPSAPALYSGARCQADYGSFAAQACALADVLGSEFGLVPGDRIGLYMPNRIEYLPIMYAAWWLGAAIVPINYKLHEKEATWILENSGAKCVITDTGSQLGSDSLPEGCRELGVDTPVFASTRKASGFHKPRAVEADALAWLFYTSGTTGRPKGVMLSHANLVAMSMCYQCDVDHVDANQYWLYAAPISHGAGLYNFPFVRAGGRHVVPESRGFDSAEIFSLAAELDNLCLFAAPTMIKRMVQAAPDTVRGLRTIVSGGGPIYAADVMEALDRLGPCLAQIYGQGESPMTITAMRRDMIANRDGADWEERVASVGTPQSCIEVRVVDESFQDLPVGSPGEVIVRGPTVMSGYWRDEEATRKTLVDGWLCTGDVGFLNADGFLTLTDRSKDVIISGGSNIYPREVEEVLARHPSVAEVAVVGEPHPDWGEVVVAFVVPRAGQELSEHELEQWCRSEIASFKKPKRYIFREGLPKNSYGKIPKAQLRELLRESETT